MRYKYYIIQKSKDHPPYLSRHLIHGKEDKSLTSFQIFTNVVQLWHTVFYVDHATLYTGWCKKIKRDEARKQFPQAFKKKIL